MRAAIVSHTKGCSRRYHKRNTEGRDTLAVTMCLQLLKSMTKHFVETRSYGIIVKEKYLMVEIQHKKDNLLYND